MGVAPIAPLRAMCGSVDPRPGAQRRFAILQCGNRAEEHSGYGDWARMYEAAFEARDELERAREKFQVFRVDQGVIPDADALDEFAAFIVTGSKCGVYERAPWMQRLEALVLDIIERRIRLLGVCFGHQLVASALGGTVAQREWELGSVEVRVTPRLAALCPPLIELPDPSRLRLLETHRDQVVVTPPQGHRAIEVVASSENTPVEIFVFPAGAIAPHVLCLQSHPEFSTDYVRALIKSRREKGEITPERAAEAEASLQETPEPWLQALRDFLRGPEE